MSLSVNPSLHTMRNRSVHRSAQQTPLFIWIHSIAPPSHPSPCLRSVHDSSQHPLPKVLPGSIMIHDTISFLTSEFCVSHFVCVCVCVCVFFLIRACQLFLTGLRDVAPTVCGLAPVWPHEVCLRVYLIPLHEHVCVDALHKIKSSTGSCHSSTA